MVFSNCFSDCVHEDFGLGVALRHIEGSVNIETLTILLNTSNRSRIPRGGHSTAEPI